MRVMLFLLLVLFGPSTAIAQIDFQGGKTYLPGCKAAVGSGVSTLGEAYQEGVCIGVVMTAVRAGSSFPGRFRSCAPPNSSLIEALKIVVAFLDENARRLNEPFIDLTAEALAQAWPCPR